MFTPSQQARSPFARSLYSGHVSYVDALRGAEASTVLQVAGIVGFALLTALGAQFRLAIWEVPFTLQTLAVYGSGLFLGWRNGFLAQALYLSIGLFLPVFQGDGHGFAYFAGTVTAGYLIGYPLSAAVGGFLSSRWNSLAGTVISLVAGSIILFTCGVTWLHFAAGHDTWMTSLNRGWLPFIPFDLVKIFAVAFVYAGVRRATRNPG
jgi:biotin transport system substrate-specific component